jgi:hypothetical protein
MRTERDFTKKFPPRRSGTEASGVPIRRLIVAGHLEKTFHRKNTAEVHDMLPFMYSILSL